MTGKFFTAPIPYTATAENFRSILLDAFTFITDIKVVTYKVTSTIRKWQIFFINNPGKMLILKPFNVNLTPAKNKVDDYMTGSYVDVVSLVVGSAPPLGGTVSLTGGASLGGGPGGALIGGGPSAAIPIGITPANVGPYIGATVQSMSSYSDISDPGVLDPDTIWVVTFGVRNLSIFLIINLQI